MTFRIHGKTLTLDELIALKAAQAEEPPVEPPAIAVQQYDRSGEVEETSQVVSAEKAVTLYINGRELVTLLCVGHHLEELAVGYLHAEGFLQTLDDLLELEVDDEAGKVHVKTAREEELANALYMKRTVTSGCGKGSLFYYALNALMAKPVVSDLRVTPRQVLDRIDDLSRSSASYRRTHGVHTTGLATPEGLIVARDDIGRHNAVDMIVGYCFLRQMPLNDKLLVTTGRLTSEVIIKVARLGISTLASVHAGTSLAIELARQLGVTLVGFARRGKFMVYSGGERIGGETPLEG